MINNEEYNESVEETVSEDLISKLAVFRKKIKSEYEVLDRRDSAAVSVFLDSISDRFGEEQDLNQEELGFVRGILQEDINSHNIQQKEGTSRSVDTDKEKKLNIERMKEVIQPNLESAVNNYVKFVQPFEGTRAFQEEVDIFYKHQRKYLAEDLGVVNPRESKVAMDTLMQIVRERAKSAEPVKRTNLEIEEIQKKIATEFIKRLWSSYVKIMNEKEGVIEQFWDNVASDIRLIKGLKSEDVEEINLGVRKTLENVVQNAVNKKNENIQKTQKKESEPQKNENNLSKKEKKAEPVRSLGVNGTLFKGEQAQHLQVLKNVKSEKKRVWIEKKEQDRESRQKIAAGGLQYDSKENDLIIITLHKEYIHAHNEFFDKVAEFAKENEKKVSSLEMREMKIDEGIEVYDDVSKKRSEKFGEKLKNITGNISSWLKEMPRITKRTAMTAFLVAGLTIGAMASKDKNLSSDDVVQNNHVSVEQMNQQAPSHSTVNSELFDKIVQQKSAAEPIEQHMPFVDKGEISDTENITNTFNETMIVLEDGGSVEGELIKYLTKNHSQLVEVGLGQSEGQTDSDWAGFHAHKIAQDFAKKHPGYDIDVIQKGTEIVIDANDVTKISIDINFEGGPRIVPEKMKIKKELKADNQKSEIENLRTLLQQPEFKSVTSNQITSVFEVEDIQNIKGELSKSVNDALKGNAELKEKIDAIEKRASQYYSNLPDKNKSMQNYFIRLCAKAHRDGLIKEIFVD